MSKELLTKSKIADALGTNPMRVTRFVERNKINAVKKEGKRELFKLTQFNALKEELNAPESKKDAQSHGFSKDDYILTLKQQLKEQQHQYEQVVASKDETISSLQESYNDMKSQLSVKDNQISTLTQLADQAQKLNLVDKASKQLENSESKEIKKDEKKNDLTEKKHWWNIWK
ncbi:hypothetical protein [Lactobacillus helveticus]|uniref:hypothetical protein n=1 Tax=Lactobacillus helveticus TaxID=1587 RepID=UPI0002DFD853|nr:hypothetical protein [Lactobacillus helveticus]NRN83479.1 hypothetical protein [Lactobacillus helveticus]